MPFDAADPEIAAALAAARTEAADAVRRETASTLATLAREKQAAESARLAVQGEYDALKASGEATSAELATAKAKLDEINAAAAETAKQAEIAAQSEFDKLPEAVRKARPDGMAASAYLAIVKALPAPTTVRVAGDGGADEPTEADREWAKANGYGDAKPSTIIRASNAFGPRAEAKRRAAS